MDKKLKKIETDCNCVFGKLVSLRVFQSSVLLFVTFNILLGRRIRLRRNSDFVIHW